MTDRIASLRRVFSGVAAALRGGGRPRRAQPTGRILTLWALAIIVPLGGTVGFTVATDASGYFGLNRFGGYGADELFMKNALMRHRDYNAVLFGDSRAAFTDPGDVEGLTFFNAGVGGAGFSDVAALVDRIDLSDVDLAVVMLPVGDLAGPCVRHGSRLDDPMNAIRQALTVDAVMATVDHVGWRLSGLIPDHKSNGTRYPDTRVIVPVGWDGSRTPQYRRDVAGASGAPHHEAYADGFCVDALADLQDRIASRGAELLVVLPPINGDILDAAGTDRDALDALLARTLTERLPFVVDLSTGRFSDPIYFPPADAIHFRPEIGEALLTTAIDRFCSRVERCSWLR